MMVTLMSNLMTSRAQSDLKLHGVLTDQWWFFGEKTSQLHRESCMGNYTDKDYVNTGKPSAMRRFWRKHADDCRFWVIVGLIILAGGVL